VIKGSEKVSQDQLKKILAMCKEANLMKVTVVKPRPKPPVSHPTPPPVAPAVVEPATSNPPAPAAAAAPATPPAPPSPASPALIRAVVRLDGKINFKGVTLTQAEFKSKLETMIKTTPDQAILLKAGKAVPYEKFQAALDICHSAQVKNLTVIAPAPTPAPAAAEPPTANLPAPALLMHSPSDSMSSNAPPMAPSGLPAPTPPTQNIPAENPPTTNAPPPVGP
jgi:biopolymer transport protein ExbD